jgi:hypothetical protein
VLLDSRQTTALPILLRSFLEAYADFRAIVEDSGYFKNMNASFLREKMRLLKSADQNQQNPYLAELVQAQNISKEQADLDAAMAMYRKDDRGPLDNWQRFERGKLQYEYQSIYWLLCLHGHNNLSALEDRHIEKQGEDYNVVLFREEDPEDYLRYVDTLISILIDSTEVIHRLLGATTAPYYQQYRESFAAVRTNYSTSSQARC